MVTTVAKTKPASPLATKMNLWKNSIAKFYQANIALSFAVLIGLCSLGIYSNQQAFLNLWLTRDQQATLAFNQQAYDKAARTFIDKDWIAYSFYTGGNYQQAAALFSQFEGEQAKFSQANALAHAGQYFKAAELYKALITQSPKHQQAIENLALMEKIIKQMKKSPGKKKLSTELAEGQKFTQVKKKPKIDNRPPSHALWLEQVQQNPAKFLRKKFHQEYVNEQK